MNLLTSMILIVYKYTHLVLLSSNFGYTKKEWLCFDYMFLYYLGQLRFFKFSFITFPLSTVTHNSYFMFYHELVKFTTFGYISVYIPNLNVH